MKNAWIFLSLITLLLPAFASAAWKEHPAAVQTVYQDRVPQTDRTRQPLKQFDAGRSFFPLVLYHALQGQYTGIQYELKDDAAAGFNACMPFESQDPRAICDAAVAAKMQVIVHQPTDQVVQALAHHPAMLGWYLDEEPMGQFHVPGMEQRFAAFLSRRDQHRLEQRLDRSDGLTARSRQAATKSSRDRASRFPPRCEIHLRYCSSVTFSIQVTGEPLSFS